MENSKQFACKSILVIEDEQDVRETIHDILESEGYEVYTAPNGKEALKLLIQTVRKPCFILLDLMMPIMNGFEFLAALRKEHRDILSTSPIVVLSAIADVDRARQPEVMEFMRKPFNIDKLLNVANRFCGCET